ncbi:hypothetical protein G6F50_014657 [Rhizopus delemar]|uniref:SDR family NAD(P)-dependent oxidoreductase n=1 Tax=Rhizopus delemar TaxID=936053 RepID=A0A9P6Y3E0_9FUNG|nr:hypothetical protein G6F50_014657 [Rhizopus delemar]
MAGQVGKEGVGYMEQINRRTDQMATPWHNAPLYGEQGPALEAGGFTFPPIALNKKTRKETAMIDDLKGRRILVTGSSTGIGAAVAVGYARLGAAVAVHYNASREQAEAVAAHIKAAGGVCNLVGGDPYSGVCSPDQFFWLRPFAGSQVARAHRTPLSNLFHIGAATHPGPGLGGGSGYLVAQHLAPRGGRSGT